MGELQSTGGGEGEELVESLYALVESLYCRLSPGEVSYNVSLNFYESFNKAMLKVLEPFFECDELFQTCVLYDWQWLGFLYFARTEKKSLI